VDEEAEKIRGQEWRQEFEDDADSLIDYVDRDMEKYSSLMEVIEQYTLEEKQDMQLNSLKTEFSAAMVNDMIGLGTWRLRDMLDPTVAFLVQRIESTWREAFIDDLNLYPAAKWKGKYEICDSEDPARELEGWSYGDVPFPEKGAEGYPRLLIENRVYCSRVFRKLHVEVACRQDGLQVVHVVMYPRYAYDLPIWAMDVVVIKGVVTLAIVDACPVRDKLALPFLYLQTMQELQELFLDNGGGTERHMPDWGTEIFSPACVCVRPGSAEELLGFLKYSTALHRAHCSLSKLMVPLKGKSNRLRMEELLQGHRRFVDNQLSNKKTSRVLEVAFGAEWTHEYMTQLMFDYAPDEEPVWEDSSLGRMFKYFEENPELGTIMEEMEDLKSGVAIERAEAILNALAANKPVTRARVAWALQMLYQHDDTFQQNCNLLMPELLDQQWGPRGNVGTFLARNLAQLGLGEPDQYDEDEYEEFEDDVQTEEKVQTQ